MKFTVLKNQKDSLARTGILELPHGKVSTPVFMPIATAGAVKTIANWELEELGAEIILANTYHLHLRPGEDLIAKHGGLQKWSNWNKPILTDSGGYQAFSLSIKSDIAKTTNEGVKFRSFLNGDKHFFTPESVIDIQLKIGSDIAMVLDDCAPYPATEKRLFGAVKRTGEWAQKSIDHWQKSDTKDRGLFGIIQGGIDEKLRQESLESVQKLPFDGIAVGGVSVGEGKVNMLKSVDYIAQALDSSRPHYLMGVGEPIDLIKMVDRGIDMFDCVLPTRLARHGAFYTNDYQRLNLRRNEFADDSKPLDSKCQCKVCQNFERSYIRHLFMSGEMLAARLLSYHNLAIYLNLMSDIRASIDAGTFKKKFRRYL